MLGFGLKGRKSKIPQKVYQTEAWASRKMDRNTFLVNNTSCSILSGKRKAVFY